MLYYIFSNFIIFFIAFFVLKKNKLKIIKLFSAPKEEHNYNKDILPLGGIILIFIFLLNIVSFSSEILICLFLIFILGFFSDTKIVNNPSVRFVLMILVIISFIFYSGLTISPKNFPVIGKLMENKLFNLFFLLICILLVINGSNFIDGVNNNLNFYFFYFNIIIMFIKYTYQIDYDYNLIFFFFSIIFFYFNHKNVLMFGDSGSYIVGFIIAIEIIYLTNELQDISKYFAIIMVIYPCYEVLFSVIRKIIIKINPLYPDKKHLHLILIRKNNYNHFRTSFVINLFNFIIFLLGLYFYKDDIVLIFLILTYIISYNIYHQFLSR